MECQILFSMENILKNQNVVCHSVISTLRVRKTKQEQQEKIQKDHHIFQSCIPITLFITSWLLFQSSPNVLQRECPDGITCFFTQPPQA